MHHSDTNEFTFPSENTQKQKENVIHKNDVYAKNKKKYCKFIKTKLFKFINETIIKDNFGPNAMNLKLFKEFKINEKIIKQIYNKKIQDILVDSRIRQ